MGVSKTGMQYLTKNLTDREMYEKTQDFPGCPVAKTHVACGGCGFNS